MIPTKPKGNTVPQCPRCGQCWVQRGNASGHCSQCHATFYGEAAFSKHQLHNRADGSPTCVDPMERAVSAERSGYFIDAEGQWHFGDLETATGYDQRRIERAEASRNRAKSLSPISNHGPTGLNPTYPLPDSFSGA